MKAILKLFNREGLIAIKGLKTELGHKTERTRLSRFSEVEDWLRESPKNSVRFIFDDETIDIK